MSKSLQFRGSFATPPKTDSSADLPPSALRFPQTPAASDQIVLISSIKVGYRARRFLDPPKLQLLKDSISEIGLLSPIGVTPDLELVYGGRRLQACQELGFEGIPVRFIHNLDELAKLKAEHDENVCRQDFTPGERFELVTRLYELFEPAAQERQLHSRFQRKHTEQTDLPSPLLESNPTPSGETADFISTFVGLSPATVRNIKAIRTSGDTELEAKVLSGEVSVSEAAARVRKQKKGKASTPTKLNKRLKLKKNLDNGTVQVQIDIQLTSGKITPEKLQSLLQELIGHIETAVSF